MVEFHQSNYCTVRKNLEKIIFVRFPPFALLYAYIELPRNTDDVMLCSSLQ